jgi:hypothetical protein
MDAHGLDVFDTVVNDLDFCSSTVSLTAISLTFPLSLAKLTWFQELLSSFEKGFLHRTVDLPCSAHWWALHSAEGVGRISVLERSVLQH